MHHACFYVRLIVMDRSAKGVGAKAERDDVEVVVISRQGAMDAVASGRVQDAKTVRLLQHLALLECYLACSNGSINPQSPGTSHLNLPVGQMWQLVRR